jgi:hypothetical protein
MLTPEHLETLYQCRLEPAGLSGPFTGRITNENAADSAAAPSAAQDSAGRIAGPFVPVSR